MELTANLTGPWDGDVVSSSHCAAHTIWERFEVGRLLVLLRDFFFVILFLHNSENVLTFFVLQQILYEMNDAVSRCTET